MFHNQWPVVRLKQLVTDLQPGFARDPGDGEEGIPQLRTNNVDENGEIATDMVKHVHTSASEVEKYLVRQGDVIFNNTNSPELVGKTAVFMLRGTWVFSNHMTRLRVRRDIVVPGFLAAVLHFYWKMGFSGRRAKQWVNQAAVDGFALASFPIPVPPMSEQHRIVDILNEARDIGRFRRHAADLTERLIPTIFEEMFGDPLSNPKEWPVEPLSESFEVKPNYGTMTPVGQAEDGVVCIRVGDIQQNDLDLTRAGSVPRRKLDPKRHIVKTGDILLVRAIGSLDHLGKSIVIEPQESGLAFDSHLMRVRVNEVKLLPRYVHSLFLTSGGRRLFLRNTRQSAVQVNINTEEYGRIRVPAAPINLQKEFADRVDAILALRRIEKGGSALEQQMVQSLLAHAFSGELTATWRESNGELLARQAAERDELLREAGARVAVPTRRIAVTELPTDRQYAELNRGQRALLRQITSALADEDSNGTFTLAWLAEQLDTSLKNLPVDVLRRHLDVLVARGLVKSVSRRAGAGGSVGVAFGNLYRLPLRDEDIVGTGTGAQPDFARMDEVARLTAAGRVFSASITDTLCLSDSVEVGPDSQRGDH